MHLTLSEAIYLPYLHWGVMFCKGCTNKTNGLAESFVQGSRVKPIGWRDIASLDLPQTKGVQSQEQDTSLNLVSAFSSFLLTETIQTV